MQSDQYVQKTKTLLEKFMGIIGYVKSQKNIIVISTMKKAIDLTLILALSAITLSFIRPIYQAFILRHTSKNLHLIKPLIKLLKKKE